MNRMAFVLIVIAVLYVLRDRLPGPLFRLPGDIEIHGERFHLFIPIVTCLLISLVLSFLLSMFGQR